MCNRVSLSLSFSFCVVRFLVLSSFKATHFIVRLKIPVEIREKRLKICFGPSVVGVVVPCASTARKTGLQPNGQLVAGMAVNWNLDDQDQPDPMHQRMATHGDGNRHWQRSDRRQFTKMSVLGHPNKRCVIFMMDAMNVFVQWSGKMVQTVPNVIPEVKNDQAQKQMSHQFKHGGCRHWKFSSSPWTMPHANLQTTVPICPGSADDFLHNHGGDWKHALQYHCGADRFHPWTLFGRLLCGLYFVFAAKGYYIQRGEGQTTQHVGS